MATIKSQNFSLRFKGYKIEGSYKRSSVITITTPDKKKRKYSLGLYPHGYLADNIISSNICEIPKKIIRAIENELSIRIAKHLGHIQYKKELVNNIPDRETVDKVLKILGLEPLEFNQGQN